MLQNITNFFNLIRGNKIKTTPDGSDLIPLGTRDPRYDGFYQPTGITVDDFVASLPTGGVQSVTAAPSPAPGGDGIFVNNTDPLNPVLSFTGVQVDGTTITGTGVFLDPLVAAYQAPAVDGVSITGSGTLADPLEATGSSSYPSVQVVLFADLATTERLKPCTYNNGTLGVGATLTGNANGQLSTISFTDRIDNVVTALNQNILVWQQVDQRQNGLYVVTQLGDGSNPFILTRSIDSDTQAEMYPLQINTYNGATLANRAFLQKTIDPVIGTNIIVFTSSTIGIQTSNLNFVDTVTSVPLPSCTYTSGTNLSVPGIGARLTATANGSIGTINGIALLVNNRILVKDQVNQAHNGDYTVTQVGSASTPFILTRVSAWGGEFPRLVREWKVNNPTSTKYGARYSTNLTGLPNISVGVTAIPFFEVTSGGYTTVEDEGTALLQRSTINFVGAGVTATDSGSKTVVTIPGGGGGAVNYSNVFFVDAINGNNGTALRNDFTKPYLTINQAIDNAGQGVLYPLPTNTDRALVYVRRGTYTNNIARLLNYVDIYCEPGVVFINAVVHDQNASVICNFYGKAKFTGNVQSFSNDLFRLTGTASKVYFEFDDLFSDRGAIGVFNGSSATIVGRKIFAETFNTSYGCTFRGSGTITLNITEEIAAWHDVLSPRAFSGKLYVTCPRIYLHEGNYYGGDAKHCIIMRDNLGGEAVINGDLIVNPLAGYYAGISAVIGRWTDSFGTIRLNGNIYAENQFGVYGLGSSGSSRTIINGDVRSNTLCAYVASNSNVVFRNGTLMNWNNLVGVSEGYPVISMGGSGKVWVENCHMYSLGTGATQPNIAAVWKDTTTSQLCINNTVHSGSDAIGFFVRNSAPGQPVNDVRIMNSRSTKPNDTNITDLLSPTGFVQDPNIIAIGFI